MVNKLVMMRKIFCLSAIALTQSALADKIDVKPGLWETTTATEIGGMATPAMPAIPPEVLASMPAEQRARIQEMMAKSGPGKAITSQSCVTEKDLERGMRPEANKEQSCTVDSVTSSGKTQEMHLTCTNPRGKGTGVFKITATSRESYEGTMDMTTTIDGRSMSMKMQLTGKWLSANCGNVKPIDR